MYFICFCSELGAWKEIYHNNYVSVSFPFSIIKTSWAESGNGKRYLHFSAQRIRNSIFALSSTPLPLPTVIALRRKQSKDINFKSIFFFEGFFVTKNQAILGCGLFFLFLLAKKCARIQFFIQSLWKIYKQELLWLDWGMVLKGINREIRCHPVSAILDTFGQESWTHTDFRLCYEVQYGSFFFFLSTWFERNDIATWKRLERGW